MDVLNGVILAVVSALGLAFVVWLQRRLVRREDARKLERQSENKS
jgi:cell division protein FtsL